MKKSLSRILSVVLAVLMILSAVSVSVSATEIVANGRCGDDLTWVLDSEGTLTISGTGAMWNGDDCLWNGEQSYNAYRADIKTVIINEGVTNVAENAFDSFSMLESVFVSSSVKTIEYSAFESCENLTEVTLSEGLTRIEGRAFSNCSALADITLPEGLTRIDESAFSYCSVLSDITLPESLTHIGQLSFTGTGITSVRIPKNVKSIQGPITDSALFEGYTVDENNQYFSVDEKCNLFNKDKTKLVHLLFDPDMKEYTVPDYVTEIGQLAFGFNFFLEKINIPDSVKVIDDMAFTGTFSLKELALPRNLEELCCFNKYGEISFYAVDKLTIPEVDSYTCNLDNEYEDDTSHNHYQVFDYLPFLSEITVYDKDFDFTGLTIGLVENAKIYNMEKFQEYQDALVDEIVTLYSYLNLGYGTGEYDYPDIHERDFFDTNAEPDFVIDETKYYRFPGFTVRCFKGSTAESYAQKYGFNIEYLCDGHVEKVIPGYAADCYEDGLADRVVCTECDAVLSEHEIIPASHKNENGDGICDECGEMIVDCSHICHKTGFLGFFAKIAVFFWRLFGTNPVCECGAAHY